MSTYKIGDKVKLKYGGGHVGVVTAVKYECSYPTEGKPTAGYFHEEELEPTTEEPNTMMGFKGRTND
jgi:uncharacterized protein YodC (DUF2158 family)